MITSVPTRDQQALMVLLVGSSLVAPAGAHTKSTSYSNWRIEGSTVHLSFTIPLVETARLSRAGEPQPSNERVADYLTPRLSVSAGGKPCAATAGAQSR